MPAIYAAFRIVREALLRRNCGLAGKTENRMLEHDPTRFIGDLSSKLASRSRHVCVFIGAGASKACGLPDVKQLAKRVTKRLTQNDKELFKRQLAGRNLEEALSRVRKIAALIEGDTKLECLTRDTATDLDHRVCNAIVEELKLGSANVDPFIQFASWAARADYRWPLEIFTVNYDLLIETGFEERRVPYFDGFVGNLRGRFRTDLVEATPDDAALWMLPSFVRLWKLHGSVNWAWAGDTASEIVRLGQPVSGAAAIYPSDAKYDESRRVPFLVLQDRFRRALAQPETITLVSGYSFSDDHLNEIIFDAAMNRPRSEIIAFCYSKIPTVLEERAKHCPNLQALSIDKAVIGGRVAGWSTPEADLTTTDFWHGGKFVLGDFSRLAAHLSRSSNSSLMGTSFAPNEVSDE